MELFTNNLIPLITWNDIIEGKLDNGVPINSNVLNNVRIINPVIEGGTMNDIVSKNVTFTFYEHIVAAGTNKGIPATIIVDRTCTIDKVYVHLETAPGSGKTLTVDVNKGGTSIFTTQANRPSITGTDTSDESGTPDIVTLAKNDELTMDIDTNDGAAALLSVYVRCK